MRHGSLMRKVLYSGAWSSFRCPLRTGTVCVGRLPRLNEMVGDLRVLLPGLFQCFRQKNNGGAWTEDIVCQGNQIARKIVLFGVLVRKCCCTVGCPQGQRPNNS